MMLKADIFGVRDTLQAYGFWYTVWFYGINRQSLWAIFCAHQMIKFDKKTFGAAR
jgi:hypothetical protein